MNWQVIKIKVFRWLRVSILYGGYVTLVIFLSLFFLFQLPIVQERLIGRYTRLLSEQTGFPVSFQSIYLLWYDHVEITGLRVEDPEKNTMIEAGNLQINFRISSLLTGNHVNIDGATLHGVAVNLVKIQETDTSRDLNINVWISRLNQGGGGDGASPKINVGEIALTESRFVYNDTDHDSIEGFDYYHFDVDIVHGELDNFQVIGDTIQFNLNGLQAKDAATRLGLHSMQTYFRISQSSMEFLNLRLAAGKSVVSDTIVFTYRSQLDLNDFNDKVNIRARLRNTSLHPEDLALFAPEARQLQHPLQINGNLTGKVSRLFMRDMQLKYGQTQIMGRLSMDGLPALNETFITLQLNQSETDIRDLQFALDDEVYKRLRPLGRFKLNGTFTGFFNDFVANAILQGPIGTIKSDINLKINEANPDLSTYRGSLALTQFDLGTFLNDTSNFQKVTLRGNINGRGLSYSSANFLLTGTIQTLGVRGYTYQNIATNARLASQFFNGNVSIDDPNIRLQAKGSLDFRDQKNEINIEAQLDSVWLQPLGITREHLFLHSFVDINTKGLKLDSLLGDALFKNTYVEYLDNAISLDSIHVFSEKTDTERSLRIRSSLLDASVQGNYYHSTLFEDLARLAKELAISLQNNEAALKEYYQIQRPANASYDARFSIQLHNINPLTELAGINLQISKGTSLQGRFSNGYTTILHALSHIDTLVFEGVQFTQNDLELTGSKLRDSATVLALLTLQSRQQSITNQLRTKDLFVEGIWNEDHVDLSLNIDQDGLNNKLRLRSSIDFLRDTTRIKILPSRIQALEKLWTIDEENYILLHGNEISVHQLLAQHGNESILADGIISARDTETFRIIAKDLNLDLLDAISSESFYGIANGTVATTGLLGQPTVQNDIMVRDLTVNNFLIGDVHGTTAWVPEKQRFDINFFIDRLTERTVNIQGYYNPSESESPLHIDALFSKAKLQILEPVLRGIFSKINGDLTGRYQITGSFAQPSVRGEGKVEKGEIMIDYLQTFYRFTGTLEMTPTQFVFKDFDVTDAFNNKGTLSGYIAHKDFNKFRLNLDGTFTNFQVLNTTAKDNSLFYGQGYATGRLNIFGPSSNLKISATGRTEKNSKIYIPISGAEETEKKDFISFTHFTDTTQQTAPVEVKKQTELTGITMDLNLDITPDAYAEIIFDIKAGDIIRGRGNGDIKLQLDTKGEFNMFGLIEFTEGAYNFTLYDIVNKEFYIKPGSRITWYGDPYQGTMNITAGYRQLSSLSPIYTDERYISAPAIRRKYPLEVILTLEEAMLSPTIKFAIRGVDLPDNVVVEGLPPVRLNFDFNAFLNKLDEQELMRQVFSLIVLRKLSPPDAFSTSGSLANSVSELLSNQLSYWLTQVDQNLEIDFDIDLGSLDQEAFNTFQLRLSYSFLGGRLRVTRDGTFQNQNQVQQSVASLAGDWTVDYLLTPDGKFKVKMYSRSNVNALNQSLGAQTAVTTGFSLMHTQNFNEVRDLLRFARERRRREMEAQEEDAEYDGPL